MAVFKLYILTLFYFLIHFDYIISVAYNLPCSNEALCYVNGSQLVCSGGLHRPFVNGSSEITDLTLCEWPSEEFELSYILLLFGKLETLTVRDSSIPYIFSHDNQNFNSLKHLNLSSIQLKSFSIKNLTTLITLDISWNEITTLKKNDLDALPHLRNLYFAGNPINCTTELKWLIDIDYVSSINFTDEKDALCTNEIYPNKPVFIIMELMKKMEEDCPEECVCTLDRVVGEEMLPIITVNCSNLGLTEFPNIIPINTTILLLQHNKITDLSPLASDKQYWNVKDLFLDHNLLQTIDDGLEGSYWLNNFRVLSVRENFITHVHTYSLDNAFERNHNLIRVYLGSNPWRCDCVFTPHFRELLLKYQKQMKDVNDVRCQFQDGDENSLLPIFELPIKAFCVDNSLPFHPLDYLSLAFGMLTILILGKLGYDWWHFKSTGKVPWIVANMP